MLEVESKSRQKFPADGAAEMKAHLADVSTDEHKSQIQHLHVVRQTTRSYLTDMKQTKQMQYKHHCSVRYQFMYSTIKRQN